MVTTIVILSIVLAISLFVNLNQLRKQESHAGYIEELESSNAEYYTRVGESNSKLKQLDRLGSFEADDETGFIFAEMKDIFNDLNKGF